MALDAQDNPHLVREKIEVSFVKKKGQTKPSASAGAVFNRKSLGSSKQVPTSSETEATKGPSEGNSESSSEHKEQNTVAEDTGVEQRILNILGSDIAPSDMRILVALVLRPNQSFSDLEALLRIDRANLRRIVKKLEKAEHLTSQMVGARGRREFSVSKF